MIYDQASSNTFFFAMKPQEAVQYVENISHPSSLMRVFAIAVQSRVRIIDVQIPPRY